MAEAPTLYCLPSAGASGSMYRGWIESLADVAAVVPLRLAGREGRWLEPAMTQMTAVVEDLMAQITGDGPIVLAGHSMGAVVAFELAHRLQKVGRQPAGLVLISMRSPVAGINGRRVDELDDAVLTEALVSTGPPWLRDPEAGELIEMMLPTFRADLQMIDNYKEPRDRLLLECPILTIVGDDDPRVTPGQARAWAECTNASWHGAVLPGGHALVATQAESVLAEVRRALRSWL